MRRVEHRDLEDVDGPNAPAALQEGHRVPPSLSIRLDRGQWIRKSAHDAAQSLGRSSELDIQAHDGGMGEVMTSRLAHVHLHLVPSGYGTGGTPRVKRNAEATCEVVRRARRNDTEEDVLSNDAVHDRSDGSVSAAGDDDSVLSRRLMERIPNRRRFNIESYRIDVDPRLSERIHRIEEGATCPAGPWIDEQRRRLWRPPAHFSERPSVNIGMSTEPTTNPHIQPARSPIRVSRPMGREARMMATIRAPATAYGYSILQRCKANPAAPEPTSTPMSSSTTNTICRPRWPSLFSLSLTYCERRPLIDSMSTERTCRADSTPRNDRVLPPICLEVMFA